MESTTEAMTCSRCGKPVGVCESCAGEGAFEVFLPLPSGARMLLLQTARDGLVEPRTRPCPTCNGTGKSPCACEVRT